MENFLVWARLMELVDFSSRTCEYLMNQRGWNFKWFFRQFFAGWGKLSFPSVCRSRSLSMKVFMEYNRKLPWSFLMAKHVLQYIWAFIPNSNFGWIFLISAELGGTLWANWLKGQCESQSLKFSSSLSLENVKMNCSRKVPAELSFILIGNCNSSPNPGLFPESQFLTPVLFNYLWFQEINYIFQEMNLNIYNYI